MTDRSSVVAGALKLLAIFALSVAVVSGCSTGNKLPSASSATSSSPSPTPASLPPLGPGLLVALGDSYVSGYWPKNAVDAAGQVSGNWVDQLASQQQLTVVNFGCFGIKGTDYMNGQPCQTAARSASMPALGNQATGVAALSYMAHPSTRVGLVVISLGGNDVAACLKASTTSAAASCADKAIAALTPQLTQLVSQVRAVVGPDVPIIGTNYIDVWATDPASKSQANAVLAQRLDPALSGIYGSHGALFVNVDGAGFNPCGTTYFCSMGDEHPNVAGHAQIAGLVEQALAQSRSKG